MHAISLPLWQLLCYLLDSYGITHTHKTPNMTKLKLICMKLLEMGGRNANNTHIKTIIQNSQRMLSIFISNIFMCHSILPPFQQWLFPLLALFCVSTSVLNISHSVLNWAIIKMAQMLWFLCISIRWHTQGYMIRMLPHLNSGYCMCMNRITCIKWIS